MFVWVGLGLLLCWLACLLAPLPGMEIGKTKRWESGRKKTQNYSTSSLGIPTMAFQEIYMDIHSDILPNILSASILTVY